MASGDIYRRLFHRPDENLGPVFLTISWTTVSLAAILVAFRLFVRRKTHGNGWDDYVIYLALPMSLCCSIFDTQRVRYGFGRHVEYIQPTLIEASMYDVLTELLNVITTSFIKVSICLLVRRIIRGTHFKVRMVLWVMIVFLLTLAFMTCMLIGGQWPLMRVMGGEALGAATDFACVIIPIFVIRGLQLNKRSKRAIIVVLMLGAGTAACGIGRSVTLNPESLDTTYDHVPFVLCSLLERNLGFVVACMPILRPMFATMLKINSDQTARSWNWYRNGQDEIREQGEQHAKVWGNIDVDGHPSLLPKAVTSISINRKKFKSIFTRPDWEFRTHPVPLSRLGPERGSLSMHGGIPSSRRR